MLHIKERLKIAVILDAVYGHTSDSFPYSYVYRQLGYRENPFMGTLLKTISAKVLILIVSLPKIFSIQLIITCWKHITSMVFATIAYPTTGMVQQVIGFVCVGTIFTA
ncbi:hypothetical protein [Chroogloeocystis siderophila]|uniref:hypothetical protein n=1 Tax=Chroogloeocystis siderophila TaxID=329163 RepID=UPI001C4A563D|nr:hypothetical protein [Chroogloeocystis siderophila]